MCSNSISAVYLYIQQRNNGTRNIIARADGLQQRHLLKTNMVAGNMPYAWPAMARQMLLSLPRLPGRIMYFSSGWGSLRPTECVTRAQRVFFVRCAADSVSLLSHCLVTKLDRYIIGEWFSITTNSLDIIYIPTRERWLLTLSRVNSSRFGLHNARLDETASISRDDTYMCSTFMTSAAQRLSRAWYPLAADCNFVMLLLLNVVMQTDERSRLDRGWL